VHVFAELDATDRSRLTINNEGSELIAYEKQFFVAFAGEFGKQYYSIKK
jgi:hypothetical protein